MPESCNFCKRGNNEVPYLVTGPDANICSVCASEVMDVIAKQQTDEASKKTGALRSPREILDLLGLSVIGQDDAKRQLAIAVYNHYRCRDVAGRVSYNGEEIEIDKSNILLMGPTGSGKTELARTISKMLDVPFYVADCTKLTQAGYVGEDVESVLQGLMVAASHDVSRAEWGIVFLDEFDKLARKSGVSASGYRDVTGEGVQQGMLKLLEGSRVNVPRGLGQRAVAGGAVFDVIDTTHILFIAAGSFAGIEPLIERRLNKSAGMGFGRDMRAEHSNTELYRQVTVEDIENFGLIPEVVGRLPVLTSTYELSTEELVRILTEPRNAICKQFQALFSLDGVDLQFEPEALKLIAETAKKRNTGARALKYVMKEVLDPYFFDITEDPSIASILITEAAVSEPGKGVVTRKMCQNG